MLSDKHSSTGAFLTLTKEATQKEKVVATKAVVAGNDIGTTCAAIESFLDAVRTAEILHDLSDETLAPQSGAAIAKAERKLGVAFPP